MKEILVLSGKGGTGKTTYTIGFSFFLGNKDIVVDCDVDAPDMHIILEPEIIEKFKFFSGKKCIIIKDKCTGCGMCADNCHYNAIKINNVAEINDLDCEHCLLCYRICPEKAIKVEDALQGEYFISKTRTKKTFVHAKLIPGADNSGRLVSVIRTLAKRKGKELNSDFILIDGPPGIGCPVIASISGVNAVIFITEPTKSGLHDLSRVYELAKYFGVKSFVIVNKYTLNKKISDVIMEYCEKNNIVFLGKVPYTEKFYNAITQRKSIIEIDDNYRELFENFWKRILEEVEK